jgi:hypothetical protein
MTEKGVPLATNGVHSTCRTSGVAPARRMLACDWNWSTEMALQHGDKWAASSAAV